METRESKAADCYAVLCTMVSAREPCVKGHTLRREMVRLQKRYSGVFPEELDKLWKRVYRPVHPGAPVEYHDGYERMKEWFQREFGFDGSEIVDGQDGPGGGDPVREPESIRADELLDRSEGPDPGRPERTEGDQGADRAFRGPWFGGFG